MLRAKVPCRASERSPGSGPVYAGPSLASAGWRFGLVSGVRIGMWPRRKVSASRGVRYRIWT